MRKIILASESPRRRELLASLGMNFMTCSTRTKEYFDPSLKIVDALQNVALEKAKSGQTQYPNDLVIGADTIVVIEDTILGKPEDDEEAKAMLKMLSNRTHHVYTGVAICYKDEVETFYEDTEVTFYELEDEMICNYVKTKEPRDKAGAYGIQGKGSILVKKINGDYNNVVGLPISSLYRHLQKYLNR